VLIYGMSATREYQTLCNSRQFRRVYEQGRRFHAPHFSAFLLRTDGDSRRIGITVTRKIGKAVVRNRCKRRVREIVRRFFSALPADAPPAPGYDLVINVKHGLAAADFKDLQDSFAHVMTRAIETLRKQAPPAMEDVG
jgi:ribonuclease P protein component